MKEPPASINPLNHLKIDKNVRAKHNVRERINWSIIPITN